MFLNHSNSLQKNIQLSYNVYKNLGSHFHFLNCTIPLPHTHHNDFLMAKKLTSIISNRIGLLYDIRAYLYEKFAVKNHPVYASSSPLLTSSYTAHGECQIDRTATPRHAFTRKRAQCNGKGGRSGLTLLPLNSLLKLYICLSVLIYYCFFFFQN